MDIAALIISTLALIIGVACIAIMLGKNFFSTHQVQMVPAENPMKGLMEMLSPDIGQDIGKQYRDIDQPVTDEELEHLENLKNKRNSRP